MNALNIIYPERGPSGIWTFTDEARGLVNEPFIGEMNAIIDHFAAGRGKLAVIFSAQKFPGYTSRLRGLAEENGGRYYELSAVGHRGWLCSALLRYFPKPPDEIFFKVEDAK